MVRTRSEFRGWLPRESVCSVYLAVFDDETNMSFWSEECGKPKTLTSGEQVDNALKVGARQQQALGVVAPAEAQCLLSTTT